MSVADTGLDPNASARRNALVLAGAQALCGAAAPIVISQGGFAGKYLLGADASLATAPVTGYNVGVWLGAVPAAMLMARIGRRGGFVSGAALGVAGCLLAAYAVVAAAFWAFVASLVLVGVGGSFTQQYRFAAADEGTEAFKPKAISWVLAGGLLAAIVGPQTAIWTGDLLAPVEFAGAFLGGAVVLTLGAFVLLALNFERPMRVAKAERDTGRALSRIAAQPRFVVAVLCAVGSYALMSFVMTGAPLAMIDCGHTVAQSTLGIQWHVMAMFGPSFFTGSLIARFGKETIVATGMILLMLCAVVFLAGLTLANFWIGLVILGIGWNFGFIGATAMLTDTYRPQERAKAQGFNDFLVFGSVALASLSSGLTLNSLGWDWLNWIVFPVCAICLAALAWIARRERITASG